MQNKENEDEDQNTDQSRKAVIDPFIAKPPKFRNTTLTWISFIGLPLGSFLLVLICLGIDAVAGNKYGVEDLFYQLLYPDVDPNNSKKIFTAIMMTLGVSYGIVLTLIGIVLELSSSRFTGSVSSVFFRDKKVIGGVAYVVLANVLLFVIFQTVGDSKTHQQEDDSYPVTVAVYEPRSAVILSVIMVVSAIVGVFPFTNYLFFFLDPQKVVTGIVIAGLQGVIQSAEDSNGINVLNHQSKALTSIEHLRDAANKAIKKKDKNIAAKAVDALCSFELHYAASKDQMFKHWFFIPSWIRNGPDFLTLSEEAIVDLEERQTWLEWKVLRQYLELYNNSIVNLREVCYHIAMNTRIIGESAAEKGDIYTLELIIKFFNSYLRSAITKKAPYTVYIVLFQYRKLAEFLLHFVKQLRETTSKYDKKKMLYIHSFEEKIIQISKYFRYYSFTCLTSNLAFLVEVIHHDIRLLCEMASQIESPVHDKLLDVFLTVYITDTSDETAIRGIRKAQICLATTYLVQEKTTFAEKIFQDFSDASAEQLQTLFKELNNVNQKEFWEVSERGTNISFLTPKQKQVLPKFFGWFKSLQNKKTDL